VLPYYSLTFCPEEGGGGGDGGRGGVLFGCAYWYMPSIGHCISRFMVAACYCRQGWRCILDENNVLEVMRIDSLNRFWFSLLVQVIVYDITV
jgi:hypothetical protein